MKREFHSQFPLALVDSTTRPFAIDWLSGRADELPYRWKTIAHVKDDFARMLILSQAVAISHKDYARVGTRKSATGLKYWIKHRSRKFLDDRKSLMGQVLPANTPTLSLFPQGAWAVRIQFTLKKPYISKDDTDFYIIDNPVKKEWVFKMPYVAPSQWKGALRSAMMREWVNQLVGGDIDENKFTKERLRLFRLFGNEKDGTAAFLNRSLAEHLGKDIQEIASKFEEELRQRGYRQGDIEGFQGRLHFYPTFFDRIGMEVINPHDRKTGAGTNPIYFECVPTGTSGVFQLLYVPLDRIGKDAPEAIEQEAKADLEAVARGVRAMLTQYGFGAKTSSGYGVVEKKVKIGGAPPERREEFEQIWHSIGLGQPQ